MNNKMLFEFQPNKWLIFLGAIELSISLITIFEAGDKKDRFDSNKIPLLLFISILSAWLGFIGRGIRPIDSVKAAIHTSYQLASTSKTLTATGIMVLNRKGKINIDSSAEKGISRYRINNEYNKIYCISEGSDYRLYYPVLNDKKDFILLFTKQSRYGGIGSSCSVFRRSPPFTKRNSARLSIYGAVDAVS